MKVESLRSAIIRVSGAYLATAGVGTLLAVRDGLVGRPFGWDFGLGPLLGFFVGLGTALSAPLALLLGLVAAIRLLISAADRGRRAAGLIFLLGTGFFIGMLAEPITWELALSGTVTGLVAAVVMANLVLPALLAILASSLRGATAPSGSVGFEEAVRR